MIGKPAVLALAALALVPGPVPVDRTGRPLPPALTAFLARAGLQGSTTLDAGVSASAERALLEGLARARAAGLFPTAGAAVVLDLRARAMTGLAAVPDASWALRALPAGSVMKPFTAVAALGSVLDPQERIPCPPVVTNGGASIHNWVRRDEGAMTIADALARSCNTVFARLAIRLQAHDPRALVDTFARFGFGLPSGLVPGEAPGALPPPPREAGDAMVTAIGQGPLTVTPLQIARAYAAIAGTPADEWVGAGRDPIAAIPEAGALASGVREGLIGTVRTGTAADAFAGLDLDALPIAGKTGSAEIGDATPYAWFAGYAPARAPRYVVVVVVERGRRGAVAAAPIARAIFDDLLGLPRARPGTPAPTPWAATLSLPIVAGLVAPAAGPLVGFAAGAAVAGLTDGSVAANAISFALAGWIAGLGRRGWRAAWVALAAAAGTLALPATGADATWIAARAGLAAAIALVVAALAGRIVKPGVPGSSRV